MPETIPTLLNDRYRLDREIGRGGMGVVYQAHDVLLERDVAVKVLSDKSLGTEGRARLLREAQAAARLNHPNIISIYDAGEAAKLPFIVMEHLEGQSLFDHKPDSLDAVVGVARQICAALEHAHAHGIVHRDLKPENVILTPDGTAKLTDFGLALSVASRVTTEGTIVGTVFYLSPEQALGKELDGRADLYSLGVLLYELTAGRLPFTADDPLAVVSQHLHAPVVPPSTYNAAIPPALDALIVRLLSKRPEDRPASAAEVRQALRQLKSAKVEAIPVRSPLDRLARGRLVGRDREFGEAKLLWKQAASASGEERVLLISGEPGVGKTPLVRKIRALAEVSGGRVLASECYAEGNASYAPIAQIARDSLALSEVDLPDPVWADLISLAPDLRATHPDVPANPPLDPQAEQQRLFESFVILCTVLTAEAPLMLVMEDVQWADEATLYLLRHLARRSRSAGLRLLIVMTYREEELDQTCCLSEVLFDLNRERLSRRVKLTRYDLEQTGKLLKVMFQQEITPEFLEGIYRETEGNMFFIEEVCRALIEAGEIYREDGHWQWPADIAEIRIPQSVRMAIQSRVDRLPEATQEVLRLAAIFGREFDFETLHVACVLEEEALINALEAAERAQLIEEVQKAGREVFSFAHTLTQATLRESVSGLRRRRLHRRVAEAIESLRPDDLEVLAYHYGEAGATDRSLYYYLQAGERALAVYANQEAERFYSTALEQSTEARDRAAALSGLGEALFRKGRYEEAVERWHEAIDLYQEIGDQDNLARHYARAGRGIWHAGDLPGGLALCQEGMAAVPADSETPGMAMLLHETARAYVFNKLPDQALPLCEQALEMAKRLGLVDVQADTLATLGILPNLPPEKTGRALQQAVELAESAGLLDHAIRAHVNLASHVAKSGDHRSSYTHTLRARELAHQAGNIAWEVNYLVLATDTALVLADFAAVEEALPVLRQLVEKTPNLDYYALFTEALQAYLRREQGEWSEAASLLQSGQDRVRQGEPFYFHLWCALGTNLAEMMIELGRPEEAQEISHGILEEIDRHPDETFVWARSVFSVLHSRQGQIETARQLLQQAEEQAGESPAHTDQVAFLWARSSLAIAEQRWPEALEALQEAVEIAAQCGARWHQGRMLREHAEVYAARGEAGDRDRAAALFREALDVFEEIQAPGYAALVQDRLQDLVEGDT